MKKLLLTGLVAANMFAAQVALDISGTVNGTLQDLSGVFPEGTVSNAGIEFTIGPSTGPNYWNALLDASSNPRQMAVPVNFTGVTHLYALINTMMGTSTPGLASLTLFASDASTFVVDLDGDDDIRSYEDGIFTNNINNTLPAAAGLWGTVNWFSSGSLRLDALVVALPTDWAGKTVTMALFEDNGDDESQRIFISGVTADVTTAPTPEPATFGLIGAALVAFGLRKRR